MLFPFSRAITGGIASGKSTAAGMFRALGAFIVDADHISRSLTSGPGTVLSSIEKHFGKGVLDSGGGLKRDALRRIIIDDPREREILNSIIHPVVLEKIKGMINELLAEKPGALIITDVPLLFETGWQKHFAGSILVYAPRQFQIHRLMGRDSLTQSEAEKTLGFQMDIEEKKTMAEYVIDNSGSFAHTASQVEKIHRELINNRITDR